ncbi:MAG: ABC transporter permease [Lentisphaerae bacterium]|nr:ABC transporter permease [Lentisphaerota bacterium]
MRIPIVLGRALSPADTASSRKVAVINETMARIHFAGSLPVGRTFSAGENPDLQDIEVVGVMKDSKHMHLDEGDVPAAFFPYSVRRLSAGSASHSHRSDDRAPA